jgi:hypothetical protein
VSAGKPGRGPAARWSGVTADTLLIALVLGSATYFGVATIDRASEAVYGIPGWGAALTALLLSLVVLGCGLIVWSRQPVFSAVMLAGVAASVLGLLAILSFGVLALIVAGGLLTWAGSGRWSGARRGRAAAGAVLAGTPLPVLVVFAMAGPLVDCDVNGVTSGENVFWALGSARGGDAASAIAASDASGAFSGRAEGPGYDYSYVCRDGTLVEFDLHRR